MVVVTHPISASSRRPPTPPLQPTDPQTTMAPSDTTNLVHNKIDKHIWVITGPAGCGKTSVAANLHAQFGWAYLEGDDFHTPENIAKMSHGEPLTDADRWDWLIRLREESLAVLSPPPSPSPSSIKNNNDDATDSVSASVPSVSPKKAVLLTCSALKRKYRDVLRVAALEDATVAVHFVFLALSEEALLQRVAARQGHYMKESMVRSQLASLETPSVEVERDVVVVQAGVAIEEVGRRVVEAVEVVMRDGL